MNLYFFFIILIHTVFYIWSWTWIWVGFILKCTSLSLNYCFSMLFVFIFIYYSIFLVYISKKKKHFMLHATVHVNITLYSVHDTQILFQGKPEMMYWYFGKVINTLQILWINSYKIFSFIRMLLQTLTLI